MTPGAGPTTATPNCPRSLPRCTTPVMRWRGCGCDGTKSMPRPTLIRQACDLLTVADEQLAVAVPDDARRLRGGLGRVPPGRSALCRRASARRHRAVFRAHRVAAQHAAVPRRVRRRHLHRLAVHRGQFWPLLRRGGDVDAMGTAGTAQQDPDDPVAARRRRLFRRVRRGDHCAHRHPRRRTGSSRGRRRGRRMSDRSDPAPNRGSISTGGAASCAGGA